uniref:Protein phosphatase n=1 Tax=Tetraselmis sp. GSL018 TaxID=582737 RepID=A0A061QJK1_9CHLO
MTSTTSLPIPVAPTHNLSRSDSRCARQVSSQVKTTHWKSWSLRRVAAASCSMSATTTSTTLCLKAAVKNLPHPEKLASGGEDAWFISTAGAGSIGVADGVGGWQENGIDAGEYSRVFMKEAQKHIEGSSPVIDPFGALKAGHDKTRLPGSTTAVVLQLNPESSKIEAINLGDSGFAVFRDGRAVFRSEPLQHYFDCPFQFGAYPEYVEMTDTPVDAQEYRLTIKPGDVVVMGSDGLWDNCFEEEIAKVVTQKAGDLEAMAEALASLARRHAADETFDSPYIQAAASEGFDLPWWEKLAGAKVEDGKIKLGRLTGGKMDDITVIVAEITEREVEPEPEPEAEEGEEEGEGGQEATLRPSALSDGSRPVEAEQGPAPAEKPGQPPAPPAGGGN